jgi:hypothetical protein
MSKPRARRGVESIGKELSGDIYLIGWNIEKLAG